MVKKEPAENKSTIINASAEVEKATVQPSYSEAIGATVPEGTEVAQPPQPIDQLLKILTLQEERQSKIEQQVARLTNVIASMTQAMDAKAEETPKGMNSMDMIKTLTDIMNGPIGQMITKALESLGGGEETAATAPAMSAEEIKKYQELAAYRDGRMKRMDEMQENWMVEMVKSLQLKNSLTKKELDSDIT